MSDIEDQITLELPEPVERRAVHADRLLELVETVRLVITRPAAIAFTAAATATLYHLKVWVTAQQLRVWKLAAGRIGWTLKEGRVAVADVFEVVHLFRVDEHGYGKRVDRGVSPLLDK